MSKEIKYLVLEMSVGMACYELILGIAAWFLHKPMGFALGPALAGILAGFFCDILMLIHMAHITERAVDSMDEGYANKTTLVQGMVRKVVFIAVLLLLVSITQINAVTMIMGALALKAGAYLQPAVHKIFLKIAVV